MKYLVVLLIALATFVAADEEWKPVVDKEKALKLHEDCGKEAGLTTEQMEKVNKMEFPDEKEVRDYILCSVKGLEVFSEDKGFCVNRLMTTYNAMFGDVEKERDSVKNCVDSNEQKSTPAEWTYRVTQCIMNTKIGELLKKSEYYSDKTA